MAGINIDNVKPRPLGPQRRIALPAAKGANVGQIHRPRRRGQMVECGLGLRGQCGQAGQAVGRMGPAVPKLYPRQRAVGMDRISNAGQGGDIFLAPQGQIGRGAVIRRRVDRAILGTHHTPPTLGLNAAQRCRGLRPLPAKARGMGGLVKAVGGRDGADLDRFKQYGVGGIHQASCRGPNACYTNVQQKGWPVNPWPAAGRL